MLKKRLIGVITIKDNFAVQSFGYNQYLPLGKPEILAKNLDRWGADEIILNVIDRSIKNKGPDFNLLEKVAKFKLSTPIIYGGGINSKDDAEKIIKQGADRIILENIFYTKENEVERISDKIGKQAIIMSLPVSIVENKIKKFNYITKKIESIPKNFLKYIHNNLISEIMLIDYINEGSINKFNIGLIKKFQNKNIPLILFGGVGEKSIILNTIKYNNVSAIAIGNSLNYSENKVQSLKSLSKKYFRELNNGH